MTALSRWAEKWTETPSDSYTRQLYRKRYRIQRPDGSEKLVETEAEASRYLRLWYDTE